MRTAALILCAIAGTWSVPAAATTIIRLSPDEVAAHASVVVVATVTATQTWATPDKGTLRTDLLLDDVEVLKPGGFVPDRLTYTGGELGDVGMAIPGMPDFAAGMRAVFFIEGDGQSEACPTVGWNQGYYPIDGDDLLLAYPGGWLRLSDQGHLVVTDRRDEATRLSDLRTARVWGAR